MISNNFNQLDKLNSEERKIALRILNEMSSEGVSSLYNDLLYSEYKEIPVDIITFLTDDKYLGNAWKDVNGKLKVYDFWLEQLKNIFPNNTDTNYNTLLESGARGIGKSEIAAGIIFPYLIHRILCLKNPLEYFHLKPTEKIYFAFMNIKLELSEEIALSKFQKTIQLSPWFMSRGNITSYHRSNYWNPPEPIEIIIGSQADDLIGKPIFAAFFDEISFIRNQDIDKQKVKAKDMIDTAIGGMFTRFIHNGKNPTMLIVASSKRSEQSFMEHYIRTLTKVEGSNVYVVDEAVWNIKPKGTYKEETFYIGLGNKYLENIIIPDEDYDNLDIYKERGYKIISAPIDFKEKFIEDIDRGLCDFAGISTASSNKYMSAQMVSETIDKELFNPLPDIIETGNAKEDKLQYYNVFNMEYIPEELKVKPLYIHLDMSISGDMTGIAGVWIIGKKVSTDENQSKDLRFRLAFSTSIKAPKGHQISFEKNRNFIRWLKEKGFNIKGITCDTFQSYDLLQQLSAEGFETDILSVDRVTDGLCKPYQYLRSCIYEKRFVMYKSERLFDEFVDIERNINTGKIDHSPNAHKDALDAVCGATYNASRNAEQYAFEFGEDLETTINVSSATNDYDQQQIIKNVEEQLKSVFTPFQNTSEQAKKLDFGFGPSVPLTNELVGQGIMVW